MGTVKQTCDDDDDDDSDDGDKEDACLRGSLVWLMAIYDDAGYREIDHLDTDLHVRILDEMHGGLDYGIDDKTRHRYCQRHDG